MLQMIWSTNGGLSKYSSISEKRRCQDIDAIISTSLKQCKTILQENDGDECRNRGDDAVLLLSLRTERKASYLFYFSSRHLYNGNGT